jgi:mercuric reductase
VVGAGGVLAWGGRCGGSADCLAGLPRASSARTQRLADADTDEVLGVAMVGNSAGEVIHEAAMALRFRATLVGHQESQIETQ